MKTLNTKLACKVTLACVFFLLIVTFPGSAAEIDDSLAKCAGIKDDNAARLKCFDELAGRKKPVTETDMTTSAATRPARDVSPEPAQNT
jgi:hypothetical protein